MINRPTFPFLQLIPNIRRSTRSTNQVMKRVSHARPHSRFIETTSNLKRKKLHQQMKAPIFLEAVLAIETLEEPQRNIEEKGNSGIIIYQN